jgi:hypothetical protein
MRTPVIAGSLGSELVAALFICLGEMSLKQGQHFDAVIKVTPRFGGSAKYLGAFNCNEGLFHGDSVGDVIVIGSGKLLCLR